MDKIPEATFYVLLRQDGEGCDYSIRCGLDLKPLKSQTETEAIEEVRHAFDDDDDDRDLYLDFDDVRAIAEAWIIAGSALKLLPLADWESKYKAEAKKRRHEEKVAAERAEFERLRVQFGGA